jgi:HPt (histidine-containing phosphotransfer) domain-containing protein
MSARDDAGQPQQLLDPAAIDRLRKLGGDSLLIRMIDLFLENGPRRVSAALEAAANHDVRGVEHAAHSLKSSAANLGATKLRQLSEQLEIAASRAAAAEVQELIPLLAPSLDQTCQALRELKGLPT